MTTSDLILERLLSLHPKEIDLSLERIERLLERLGHPERKLPPVIHVAGTNGKGSVVAYCRAMLEAAGKRVHVYTSPHLVRFHERIRIGMAGGGQLVSEDELSATLEECERINAGAQITFFEITTAAAFLLFSRYPADYLVLEVGLGGRVDATNVIDKPAVTVITPVSLDHPQFLGTNLPGVAAEKAGILKHRVPCAVAAQSDEALQVIRSHAARRHAPLQISGEQWHAYEQHGRLLYQDDDELLDLPLPRLPGRHQLDNAGTAIAAVRLLKDPSITHDHIEQGLTNVDWAARLQRLGPGALWQYVPADAELWLDGGHNPAAGEAIAQAMSELEERVTRPLILVSGMINTKDAGGFFAPFVGLARQVVCVTIPGEKNAIPAADLADMAIQAGLIAGPAASMGEALLEAGRAIPSPRILICGSLYLAGKVLAMHALVSDKT